MFSRKKGKPVLLWFQAQKNDWFSHLFLGGFGPPPVLVHDHGRGLGVDLPGEGGVVPHHDGDGPEEDALVGAVAVEAVAGRGEYELAPAQSDIKILKIISESLFCDDDYAEN